MAFDTIISGNIGSGQIGSVHLADGALGSGNIGSGSVSQFALASGAVNSGHIASGAVLGSVGGGAFTIASGTIGPNDHGSGSVLSGSIASGQVGQFAISSGAVTSGRLGVAGTPNGTLYLRDDFSWQPVVAVIGSGTVGSGAIASGAVQGFFGTTPNIASGTVGVFDLGSGAVVAGTIGSGAVVAGNIASGQVQSGHLTSGTVIVGNISSGAVSSGKLGTSVVFAITIASGQVLANKLSSGSVLSGHIASGAVTGAIQSGARVIASGSVGGFDIASGGVGSGQLAVTGTPDGTKFLRDDFSWQAVTATVGSGSAGSGSIASGAVQGFFGSTRHVASGTLGVFDFGSGAVAAGAVGSGAVQGSLGTLVNVASGTIGPNDLGSGAVLSGAIASGQIGNAHIGSGTVRGAAGFGVQNIASGSINSVNIANAGVTSGSIQAGAVFTPHLASGAVQSGKLGITAGTPDGTKYLRDDFSWSPVTATIGSGSAGSGSIASGSIPGFFGPTRAIQSGTIGVFDLGSGAVVAGSVGSGAIVSGNIASGQIGPNHAASGVLSVFANVTDQGFLVTSGIISPTDTGTVDDWAPAGIANATHVRCVNSAGSLTINGIAGGVDGRILTISAMSSNSVSLVNNAGTSTAANRISTNNANTVSLPALSGGATSGNSITLIYDGTISRWRVLAINSTYISPPSTFADHLLLQAGLAWSGTVSPASITGTNNNYAPGGDTFVSVVRQDLTADATITGLSMSQSTYAGKIINFQNISASFSLTFTNEDAGSTAANRFTLAGGLSLVLGPLASVLLRYDSTTSRWRPMASSAMVASGGVSSGDVASGAVTGFFGPTRNIASGTVGSFDFGSGAVTAGKVGSGAVVSGNVASGQLSTFHNASGAIITYGRSLILDQYRTSENVSGVRCVQFDPTRSGAVRVAMAAVSGRFPAFGVAFTNALSGQSISIIKFGEVSGPASEIGSGIAASGRWGGKSLWMGASGQVVVLSGGGPTIGVGATNSGSWGQFIGRTTSSGTIMVDPNPLAQFSGAANITTNPQQWPV